jgi:hypothetical protein
MAANAVTSALQRGIIIQAHFKNIGLHTYISRARDSFRNTVNCHILKLMCKFVGPQSTVKVEIRA